METKTKIIIAVIVIALVAVGIFAQISTSKKALSSLNATTTVFTQDQLVAHNQQIVQNFWYSFLQQIINEQKASQDGVARLNIEFPLTQNLENGQTTTTQAKATLKCGLFAPEQ